MMPYTCSYDYWFKSYMPICNFKLAPTWKTVNMPGPLRVNWGIQNFQWTRIDKSRFTVHKILVQQHQMSHNETGGETGSPWY